MCGIGLGTEFRSEKIPRNKLGTVSVIPRKKVLNPSSAEEPIPKLGTEWNEIPRTCTASMITLTALHSTLSSYLFRGMVRNGIPRICFYFFSTDRNSESLLLFLFNGTEFRVVFSSAEGFGREILESATILVPRNGIPSCFIFRGRVRNGIPSCFLFRGTAGIPSEIIICSVYSVFRGIMFLSEIPNSWHRQVVLLTRCS